MVEPGLTTCEKFDPSPWLQLKLVAPDAEIVIEFPAQIVAEDGETLTVGFGLTVTVTDVEPVQPELVPVTVYVVVEPGLTF